MNTIKILIFLLCVLSTYAMHKEDEDTSGSSTSQESTQVQENREGPITEKPKREAFLKAKKQITKHSKLQKKVHFSLQLTKDDLIKLSAAAKPLSNRRVHHIVEKKSPGYIEHCYREKS